MRVLRSEQPPGGLGSTWEALWRVCLRTLEHQQTWSAPLRPLLDEFVFAAKHARDHREAAQAAPFAQASSGRVYAHPGFALADQAAKRAGVLADLLALTPRAQKALGVDGERSEVNPLDVLDAESHA